MRNTSAIRKAAQAVRFPVSIEPLEARRMLAVDMLSYHGGDLSSIGVNANETQLTPGNVKPSTFGKQFQVTLDGQAYTQPLVKTGVNITTGANQGVHDVVFVGTEHDSFYALDANGGTVLWKDSFITNAGGNPNPLNAAIPAGVTSVPSADVNSGNIAPEIGITATPVIDPTTGLLYLTAKTKEIIGGATHYIYRLHKINIQNGVDSSTIIGDTIVNAGAYTYRTSGANTDPYVVGTGDGAINVGGQSRVYFNTLRQLNRPGLVLYNNHIYIAFASHGDNGPYHGWLLGYDKTTLAITGAFNTTPNGGLGGIWQGGGITAVDSLGNFYLETGNGTFDSNNGVAMVNGFQGKGDYSDCFLKIALDSSTPTTQNINGWGFKLVDYFSPFNNAALDGVDRDLGSGASILLPDSAGSTQHPHLLVGSGKEGKIYLIDRDNMGKFDAATDHVVQTIAGALSGSLDTPAYFNGRLYYMQGYSGPTKSWALTGGAISTVGVQQSPDSFGQLNGSPSISANGVTNGIVWCVDRSGQLRAYDANNLATELWTSNQNSARDALGGVLQFEVPTVVNGRVYVGTASSLVAYGPPVPPTAPPAAPSGLTATAVSGSQISLSWVDNSGNEDGFKVEESTDNGSTWAQIADLGVNTTALSVGGLQLATSYSFRVRAYNSFNTLSYSAYSNNASATTTSLPPTLDFSTGFANSGTTLQLNGNAKINGSLLELTDGALNETSTAWGKTKQDITHFSTAFSFQLTAPDADGITFAIQNNLVTSSGGGGGALAYAGIPNSIAIKFDLYPSLSTTGLYTGGAAPGEDANALDMSSAGIDLHSGHIFDVTLSYDGATLQEIITDTTTQASFGHTYSINIPTTVGANTAFVGFTGATGGLAAVQDIRSWTYTATSQTPPTAPTGLTLTPASTTEIDLSWTDTANNETGFKIERSTDGVAFTQIATTVTNQTTYNDTALSPATQYWYRVRATNPSGDSAYATAGPVTTPVAPNAPSNFVASQITTTSVHISWQDNSTDESGFVVARKKGTSEYIQQAILPANTTSWDDPNLLPGTAYDYHIQAYNIGGYSDLTGGKVLTLTASPTPFKATPGNQSMTLNWTLVTGADSYNLYRASTSQPLTLIASGLTGASYFDTGLTNGVHYLYKVAGVDATGEGALATILSATPVASSSIAGHQLFYNNSFWTNPANGFTNDDAAIDTSKSPLLNGGTATFANYSGSFKGINGIMIDVNALPAGTPGVGDFTFKIGNNNTPSGWATAPDPTNIIVRRGAGVGGSDRIELIWADNAIQNTWLQVTVNATPATGIATPDVFYYGNAIGETGNTAGDASVNSSDIIGVRDHPTSTGSPALVTNQYDFNHDAAVNSTDMIIARDHPTSSSTVLQLIAPTAAAPAAAPAAAAPQAAAPSATAASAPVVVASSTKVVARPASPFSLVPLAPAASTSWMHKPTKRKFVWN